MGKRAKLDDAEIKFLRQIVARPGHYIPANSFRWIQTNDGEKAVPLWVNPEKLGLIQFDRFYRWQPTAKLLNLDL